MPQTRESIREASNIVAAQFEPLVAMRYLGTKELIPEKVTTFRPRKNDVVSPKLKAINDCMRRQLEGRTFEDLIAQRTAFATARKDCSYNPATPSSPQEPAQEKKRKK